MKVVTVNVQIQFDIDGNREIKAEVAKQLEEFTQTLQERFGDISPIIFAGAIDDQDIMICDDDDDD